MEATFVPPRSAISYLWPHNWHTSSTTRCLPALLRHISVHERRPATANTHTYTFRTISLFCALLVELFVCRFSIFSLSFFIILLPFAKWRQMSELLKAVMVNKNIKQGQRRDYSYGAAYSVGNWVFAKANKAHHIKGDSVEGRGARFKQVPGHPFHSLIFMRIFLSIRFFRLSLLMSICFECSSVANAKVLHTFVRASIINLLSSLAKYLFSFNFAITLTHTWNLRR